MGNLQNRSKSIKNNQHTGNEICTKETPTKNLRAKKVIENPSSSYAGKNGADIFSKYCFWSILEIQNLMSLEVVNLFI